MDERPPGTNNTRSVVTGLRELIGTLFAAVLLALLVRTFAVESFVVSGTSMLPTLLNGEHLLVNKLAYRLGTPHDGQVIVFMPPIPNATEDYVKRVIATPGQTVSIRHDRLYVNGKVVPEPFLEYQEPSSYSYAARHPLTVPKGDVFVLGDNRPVSYDSRYFGMVPIRRIAGEAMFAFWPIGRIGAVGKPEPGSQGYKA